MSLSPSIQPTVPDLTTCEREPIHLAGAVEPNGCILVLVQPSWAICQTTSNTLSLLGLAPEALLEMRLADVFAETDIQRLLAQPLEQGKRHYVKGMRVLSNGRLFDALAHRQEDLLLVELEPASTEPMEAEAVNPDIYVSLTSVMAEFKETLPLSELCQRVAVRVRRLTGFDRVMVYRFLKDDSGSVIAEDKRDDLVPYLGLRYPASDIPAQARRFYLINTLRLKADVQAASVALLPPVNPVTRQPLDMTYCVLRAMSPVHVEYLRNMGVAASMSISIIKDSRLWGLIACHHTSAHVVPHRVRITCEVLARVFSSHIAAAEERDEQGRAAVLHRLRGQMETNLLANQNVVETLTQMVDELAEVMDASGCAFHVRSQTIQSKRTPSPAELADLLAWLALHQTERVLSTDQLSLLYPNAAGFQHIVSGLLSIRIALGGSDFLLWFRPPVTKVVNWGGNPEKPVEETDGGQRMSPRHSFEKWKQTVRDRSEPWTDLELEFASAFRPLLAEALCLEMNREIVNLNLELDRSNVELDAFAYSASHDMSEPLRSIRVFTQILARKEGDKLGEDSRALIRVIDTSAARMGSLIDSLLSYSQIGGAERHTPIAVSLEEVMGWVLTHLQQPIQESGALITHDPLPVVLADSHHMLQLLQNLIGNAVKYGLPNQPPRIHVAVSADRNSFLFSVRDEGQGFEADHAQTIFAPFKRLHGKDVPGHGIGLATCRRIVNLYHGRIWADSPGLQKGATFWFTLPSVHAGS